MTDSLLVNDDRWIEFVEEKITNKQKKYKKMKNIGICLILLFVTGQSIVSEELDTDLFHLSKDVKEGDFWLNATTFVCLDIMMGISIFMLVEATRTMRKLAAASGDNEIQSFGLKTINLNLLAACLQFVAFIVWTVGFFCIRYLKQIETIKEENDKVFDEMMISTVSSVILLISYYLIIHVFWHYGINVEKTLIKREKIEEEKRRQTEE